MRRVLRGTYVCIIHNTTTFRMEKKPFSDFYAHYDHALQRNRRSHLRGVGDEAVSGEGGFFDPKGLKNYLLKIKNKKIVYYLGHSFAGFVDIDQATEMSSNDLCCIIYCGDGIGY